MAQILSVVTKKIDGTIEVDDGRMECSLPDVNDWTMSTQEFINNYAEMNEAIERGFEFSLPEVEEELNSQAERAVAAIKDELQTIETNFSTVAREQPTKSNSEENGILKTLLLQPVSVRRTPKKPKSKGPAKYKKSTPARSPKRGPIPDPVSERIEVSVSDSAPSSISPQAETIDLVFTQEEAAIHSEFQIAAEKWRKIICDERKKYHMLENQLEEKLLSYAKKRDMRRKLMLEMAKEEREIKELRTSLARKQRRLQEKEVAMFGCFD